MLELQRLVGATNFCAARGTPKAAELLPKTQHFPTTSTCVVERMLNIWSYHVVMGTAQEVNKFCRR